MNIRHAVAAGLILAVAGTTPGCVSKKVFRKTITEQDQKIDGVRTGVEENEQRITDLRTETSREVSRLDGRTNEAMAIGQKADGRAQLAEKMARGTVLWEATLNNDEVKFDFNRYALKPGAQGAIDAVADRIKGVGHQVYIEIEGHTDSTGTPEYNQVLGAKRADAVRGYLHERHQIPLHLIETVSLGESRPIASNGDSEGRSQNRRVVIRVLDPIAPILQDEVARVGTTQH